MCVRSGYGEKEREGKLVLMGYEEDDEDLMPIVLSSKDYHK